MKGRMIFFSHSRFLSALNRIRLRIQMKMKVLQINDYCEEKEDKKKNNKLRPKVAQIPRCEEGFIIV